MSASRDEATGNAQVSRPRYWAGLTTAQQAGYEAESETAERHGHRLRWRWNPTTQVLTARCAQTDDCSLRVAIAPGGHIDWSGLEEWSRHPWQAGICRGWRPWPDAPEPWTARDD